MKFIKFLAEPYFLNFFVPLIAVGLSVFLKYVSRNDRHKAFRKEDLAVGLDLAITALLIFITDSVLVVRAISKPTPPQTLIEKSMAIPWISLAFVLGIWGISTLVRKMGWQEEDNLKVIWGITVPDIFGILTLIFVVNWIG